MHFITVITGDWSGDGHSITEMVNIESNLSHDDMCKAYEKGCEILGFDFSEQVCKAYEESHIEEDKLKSLQQHDIGKEIEYDDYMGKYVLDPDLYAQIYLAIVKLGKKEFYYEIVPNSKLCIGGYGLFR